jgi:asparagine synthase (glutamine-hydrolysing)
VLTGTGGDELFAGTNLYLCDLFRSGHWLSLAAEWYRIRGRTLQGFGTQVVRPAFAARRPDSRLSEGGPLEQGALTWMSADFIRTHRFLERERAGAPYERYRSLNAAEMHWAVTAPLFSRIRSTLSAAQLEAGVTHRSPFFDGRLLRFAMSRPRAERVSARETKRLLRRAMKGLLPDEFLAPRPERTGVTTQYMRDEVQRVARYELSKAFEQPVLAELGIIDRDVLRREWNLFLDTGNTFGLRFFELYQVEMWVRAHIGAGIGEHQSRAAMPAASV